MVEDAFAGFGNPEEVRCDVTVCACEPGIEMVERPCGWVAGDGSRVDEAGFGKICARARSFAEGGLEMRAFASVGWSRMGRYTSEGEG